MIPESVGIASMIVDGEVEVAVINSAGRYGLRVMSGNQTIEVTANGPGSTASLYRSLRAGIALLRMQLIDEGIDVTRVNGVPVPGAFGACDENDLDGQLVLASEGNGSE